MNNNYSDSESDTELSNEELINRMKENELLKNLKYEYHPIEIRDFYDFYLTKEKKINFKPVYQRKFSWNSSKQDLFIDSIINNYIIPPIILIKLENEEYEWECIDGQHRLCVIKHFIESTPIDNTKPYFIRYKRMDGDTSYNVLYDDTFDKRDNIKKYIKNKSYFTQEEKKKFNSRTITILKISNYDVKNKDGMERLKKNMFLRLQNGERVSAVDKFKNIDKPIINALNNYDLLDIDTYNDERLEWNKLLSILDIPVRQKNTGITKVRFIHIFIITCLLIIQEKTFDIGSYLDLNILKYIEVDQSIFKKNISVDAWKKCIDKLKLFIIDLYSYLIEQTNKCLHKNILYVILFQYITNKTKYDIYKTNIIELIKLYDLNKSFKEKEEKDKIIDYIDFKNFVSEIDDKIKYINEDYINIDKNIIDKNNSIIISIKKEKQIKNIDIYQKNKDLLKDYYIKKHDNSQYKEQIRQIYKNLKNNRDLSINDINKVIYEYNNKNSIISERFEIFLDTFENIYSIDDEKISEKDIDDVIYNINIENKLIMESYDNRKFMDKFKQYMHIDNLSDNYLNILNEYYKNYLNKNTKSSVELPKKKQAIPKVLKDNVWNKYIGVEIGQTYCLCCKTNKITQSNFHCGHVISESKGGKMDCENLRPICSSCNLSMGSQNMDLFIEKCGFNKN